MSSSCCRYHICVTPRKGSIFSALRKRVTLSLMDLLRNKKVYVNGKFMNETTESTVTSGKIGFQAEGAPFEVRKIYIEPLK